MAKKHEKEVVPKENDDEQWNTFENAMKHIGELTPQQVEEIRRKTPEPEDLPKEDLGKE
jgi:predicted Zn-dependent peptidase